MGMFGQVGDMYKLQKEAKKIKKELSKMHIFAEEGGVKVTVNGEQQLVGIEIIDESLLSDKSKLEKGLMEATNKSMKKAQEIAAKKMQPLMGGLQGMMGGEQ